MQWKNTGVHTNMNKNCIQTVWISEACRNKYWPLQFLLTNQFLCYNNTTV